MQFMLYIIIMNRYSLAFSIYIILSLFQAINSSSNCSECDLQKLQKQIDEIQNNNFIFQSYMSNYQSIKNIQKQIQSRTKKLQDKYNSKVLKQVPFEKLDISKQMHMHCQIKISQNSSHFLFQTPRGSYVIINNFKQSSFSLYSHDCQFYIKITNFTIKQLYCDRGLCDDGNVIMLTYQMNLLLCSQMNNFTTCSSFGTLSNIIKGVPVGGIVRNKGSGSYQVYIADSAGQIIALDGQGKLRMTIPIERNSNISHFLDMHPNPIIISSKGWIYTFENNKYTITLTKCPFLFHPISAAIMSHPYSSVIYAISPATISKIDFKAQSKGCQVLNKYHFIKQLSQESLKNRKIAQYHGQIYVGNQILKLKQQSIQQLEDCGLETQFNFQMMKNSYRKGFFSLKCCQNTQNNQCRVILFRNKTQDQGSAKNNTIIMIILLFLIILLVFYFLRSSSPNLDYDEQLKYDHNLRYKNEVQQFLQTRAQAKSKKDGKVQNNNYQNQREDQKED